MRHYVVLGVLIKQEEGSKRRNRLFEHVNWSNSMVGRVSGYRVGGEELTFRSSDTRVRTLMWEEIGNQSSSTR
jgi:hypothetical protein